MPRTTASAWVPSCSITSRTARPPTASSSPVTNSSGIRRWPARSVTHRSVPPAALGRVLGLDRAPEVKTIRRKLGELAAAGKAADLIMALARRHAAARPQTLGFLYVDGHARAYYGTRNVQKMHIARLKFPASATGETWVTSQHGDPVFMVAAEPSDSLAGELRRLLPQLRQVVGEGRQVTVCFDRGGWPGPAGRPGGGG